MDNDEQQMASDHNSSSGACSSGELKKTNKLAETNMCEKESIH